ncbi:uncharacterized protein LOC132059053 [Lycium ferocissimum]|uniref:uncharacterized protein LOC132059053 n=1 Tax=Lycium ferocissimum TaxID=112874 RepID=UPI002815133A|nr:uncharacterized protein LOC132059053 [Lycium ferocissimum]XP_059307512.1 uncharacterized protein LOC132059053 [Lycium ferocissimum]XP_059307513.1 uncharacterized protein LOC132059053 [Lycium ferocissimum]XP_059307514.1 uncharacterized protein LOC132059053 [Lycium ferocissimum]
MALRCVVGGKEYGLAFIEPVFVVNLSNLGEDFWRYGKPIRITGYERECFGFGNAAQDIFSAIGLGMEGINSASITHGNLCNNGVMLGKYGKIRLCNFSHETTKETKSSCPNLRQKIKALIRDLLDFKELIGNSVLSHPKLYPGAYEALRARDPKASGPPDDLKIFNFFYEQKLVFSSEQNSAKSREEALFAFECFCEKLGKLFEPYVTQKLPFLLVSF